MAEAPRLHGQTVLTVSLDAATAGRHPLRNLAPADVAENSEMAESTCRNLADLPPGQLYDDAKAYVGSGKYFFARYCLRELDL